MFKKYGDSIKRVVTLAKGKLLLWPKRKGSISRSNFDVQLPNILVTCLCLCEKVLRLLP